MDTLQRVTDQYQIGDYFQIPFTSDMGVIIKKTPYGYDPIQKQYKTGLIIVQPYNPQPVTGLKPKVFQISYRRPAINPYVLNANV